MRVIMFPAEGNPTENRYLDVLVAALRDREVEVEAYTKAWTSQRGDAFHVHWPQIFGDIHARRFQSLRGKWLTFQFWSTIKRIKQGGGRVVWTAHDLVPHGELQHDPFTKGLLERFYDEVDDVICLTRSSFETVRDSISALADKRFHLGRHPHYRTVLETRSFAPAARRRIGATDRQYVFSFLGSLRENKLPHVAARAFASLPENEWFLAVAGAASPRMASEMEGALEGHGNCHLDLTRVTQAEIVTLYSASDALVFPGTDYLNSGTIYTALSLNVPVLAAWTPVNAEIQSLVGEKWLYLYRGAFDASVLVQAQERLISRRDDAVCNLEAFSPDLCAKQHIAAYAGGA